MLERQIKLYWLVIVVILIISVFVFIETSNSHANLVQYFSFAGSITSLVLGLIAIFYSIISSQESTKSFGKLNEAVVKIEKGADTIQNASETINSRLDKISDDIVKFGTRGNENQVAPVTELVSEKPVAPDPTANFPDDENKETPNQNTEDKDE